jgi:hypothetical protein
MNWLTILYITQVVYSSSSSSSTISNDSLLSYSIRISTSLYALSLRQSLTASGNKSKNPKIAATIKS